MKSLFIILIAALFLTACNSTKKTITAAPQTAEVVTETVVETAEQQKPQVEDNTVITPEELPVEINQTPPVEVIEEPEIVDDSNQYVDEIVTSTTFDHSPLQTLLERNVSVAGNVNYDSIKKDWSSLRAYIKTLGERLPDDSWSKEAKLAYWMNAYNAMTVDLILRNYPTASIKDIKDPWDQRLWKLGSKWYNLNEIEHKILRKMGDPRIHFGINCASFSCPPLLNEAFTAEKVDAQLEALAIQFVNDSKRNTITPDRIEVSKIFTWFAKDFKTDGSLVDFLNKYSETEISDKAKVRYRDYDWNLNK